MKDLGKFTMKILVEKTSSKKTKSPKKSNNQESLKKLLDQLKDRAKLEDKWKKFCSQ